MTDLKKDAEKKGDLKTVRLTAFHGEKGPGDEIEIDANEAGRLIKVGAAVLPAKDDQEPA